ncbi:MAG: hypothetical protein DSY76_02345 [Bacteroidetes bacterium]|nr:MAG: hypothetical protein DSY76_02345 [Bacteroidota bacterium]
MRTGINIGIVDNHSKFRKAIKYILSKNKKNEVTLEAETRLNFLSKLTTNIDVVFIDIELLKKDQFNLIQQIKLKNKNTKIIALSFITEEHYFGKLLHNGVNAIISKHTNRTELNDALENVMQNNIYISKNYNKDLIKNNIEFGDMSTKKVLLVDDDMDIITVAKAVLNKKGFDVHTASNKTEGIKMAKEILPDLAILDVMMTTQYEGFELAKAFKENPELKRIPVLIQSSIDVLMSTDYSVFDMAMNMRSQKKYKELDVLLIKDASTGKGCVDYRTSDNETHSVEVEGFIRKPIDAEDLIRNVNKLLKIN